MPPVYQLGRAARSTIRRGLQRLEGGCGIESESWATPEPTPFDRLAEALGRDHSLVAEWSSRTARFSRYRAADGGPSDVVVKVCERWSEADVRTSVESARRLAAHRGAASARVLRFVAWSPAPPALVSAFVPGEELRRLVRQARQEGDLAAASRWVRAAGGLLGGAHGAPPPPGVRAKSARQALRRPVLSAGDFAAYNFRLDERGEPVYMEPPSRLRLASAYRDLAWFLASIDPPSPPPFHRGRLARDVLAGYAASAGRRWTALDELFLRLHVETRRRAKRTRRRSAGS